MKNFVVKTIVITVVFFLTLTGFLKNPPQLFAGLHDVSTSSHEHSRDAEKTTLSCRSTTSTSVGTGTSVSVGYEGTGVETGATVTSTVDHDGCWGAPVIGTLHHHGFKNKYQKHPNITQMADLRLTCLDHDKALYGDVEFTRWEETFLFFWTTTKIKAVASSLQCDEKL